MEWLEQMQPIVRTPVRKPMPNTWTSVVALLCPLSLMEDLERVVVTGMSNAWYVNCVHVVDFLQETFQFGVKVSLHANSHA